MLAVMIDTMVFDLVVEDPEALETVSEAIRHGRVALFTTPIQEFQLAAVSDVARRKRLQTLPREVIPALGAPDEYDKHAADAAIAETTAARCDVLVTEDRRLAEDAREDGIDVWTVSQLLAWLAAAETAE